MKRFRIATALFLAASFASTAKAHYIWVIVEASETPGAWTLSACFNEPPVPDATFVKYVQDVKLTVDGHPVPSTLGDDARNASWVGKAPVMVDSGRDLGLMNKGGKAFRLIYTARAQTAPVAADAKETGDGLRVRLIESEGGPKVEVLNNGEPVPNVRIRAYPEVGEPTELTADEKGLATIEGVAQGKTALWANWVDPTPGEVDGKPFDEVRHYATFTFAPTTEATSFATMPEPAVNSFGGAVLGKWLYVYSGHVGKTHRYSEATTDKHFRRLDLEDRTTWEDLPMGPDVQGVALVTDGTFLYRIGGMAAKNSAEEDHNLQSVADFARFDPESKTWTDLAPLPEPRSTHDAVVIGRTVYVAGGWTMHGESDESEFPETALAFDLDRPEAGWKAIPQPFQRRALSVGEQGGKLYVLGGLVGGGMKVDRRVDVYEPKTGEWSRGPDLPGGGKFEGFGTSAIAVEGRLHFSGASGRIYRLTEPGDAWEAVGAWALPRITHRVLPGPDGSLLAVGGNAKGVQTPVIESVRPAPAVGRPADSAGD